jgi:hypothetical protein
MIYESRSDPRSAMMRSDNDLLNTSVRKDATKEYKTSYLSGTIHLREHCYQAMVLYRMGISTLWQKSQRFFLAISQILYFLQPLKQGGHAPLSAINRLRRLTQMQLFWQRRHVFEQQSVPTRWKAKSRSIISEILGNIEAFSIPKRKRRGLQSRAVFISPLRRRVTQPFPSGAGTSRAALPGPSRS